MGTEPFHWNLKAISEQSVAATEALFSFLPATGIRDTVTLELRKVLMQHLGTESYFTLESVDVISCRQWVGTVSDPAIVAVVGMAPLPTKALLQIDHMIAHHVIDRLLGGSGDVTPDVRLLTEAELGVLQYMLMQLLLRLHKVFGHDERIHFRFEQLLQRTENLLPFAPPKEDGVLMSFRLGFADHVGFVRMLFPNPLIAKAMVEPMQGAGTPGENRYLRGRLAAFGDLKASVWAEAGIVTVDPEELKTLEVGDVIVLDETDLRLAGKKIDGDLKIRVGDGQHGYLRASVRADHDEVHCTVTDIKVGG